MIYTNSTTNYTNIDTQKSVHFAVSRTETLTWINVMEL